jgi:hypothetical protein
MTDDALVVRHDAAAPQFLCNTMIAIGWPLLRAVFNRAA